MMIRVKRNSTQPAARHRAGLLLLLLDAVMAGLAQRLPVLLIPEQPLRQSNPRWIAAVFGIEQPMRNNVIDYLCRNRLTKFKMHTAQRMPIEPSGPGLLPATAIAARSTAATSLIIG